MPSKQLMGVWAFLDFCLLAAGGLSIAMSIIWRAPDLLRDLIVSDMDLTLGMVLGIFLVISFVVSIAAVVQPNHVTMGFAILNWFLVVDGIVTVSAGSTIWFWTLKERANFQTVWKAAPETTRAKIQDQLKCCGFMNKTDIVSSEFCGANAADQVGCMAQIVAFGDYTLNNIFTSIYGFTAIIICLYVASLCVINKRNERERFRKIDAKRGGRGFV
jgi:hypothetical protein